MALVDVPANWRRWNAWRGGIGLPNPEEAINLPPDVMRTVLITEPFTISDLRDWLHANSREAVRFYGRFDITVHRFRVDRQLIGLTLRFAHEDDAFFAKMRWT